MSPDEVEVCNEKDLRKVSIRELRLMKPREDVQTAIERFKIDDSRFLDESEGRSRCSA